MGIAWVYIDDITTFRTASAGYGAQPVAGVRSSERSGLAPSNCCGKITLVVLNSLAPTHVGVDMQSLQYQLSALHQVNHAADHLRGTGCTTRELHFLDNKTTETHEAVKQGSLAAPKGPGMPG